MIQFRQKEFILGTVAMVVPEMVQSHNQNKKAAEQQEEFQRQNAKLQQKQNEAMNKIAKAAETDPSKAQAAAGILQQKSYTSLGLKAGVKLKRIGQTAFEFARGLNKSGAGNNITGKLGQGLAMGTTMAAIGYGIDKAIQADRKRLTGGAPLPKPEISQEEKAKKRKKALAKVAAGTALAAGTVLAAKHGALGRGFENLYKKATGPGAGQWWKRKLGQVGDSYKKGFKEQFVKDNGKINIGGTAMTLGFGAMGGLGYLGERKQLKAQARAQQSQEQQKQYAEVQQPDQLSQKKRGSVLKKVAIGAAATAATVAAARRGVLGTGLAKKTNNMFMTYGKKIAGSKGNKLGNWMMESGAKQWGKAQTKAVSRNLRNLAEAGNTRAESVLQKLDPTKYAERAARGRLNAIKSGKVSDTIGETVLGGMSSVMGVGKKQTNSFLAQMANDKTNSRATKNLATWLGKHKKAALIGSIGVGSLAFKPFTWGDKTVRGATRAVDKNAFAYEKSKEQQIPSE
jgi:hypothetical protein